MSERRRRGRSELESTAPGGRAPDGTPLPRIVAHPELLDAAPLPLTFRPRRRLVGAFVPVVVLTILGMFSGRQGWTMGLVGLAMWAVYALLVWSDSRAALHTEGDELIVRNVFGTHRVPGREVTRVVHQYNGRSPDFQLITPAGKVWVPCSRLERGHSTLFTWLDVHAPQAVLDRQATHWRQVLVDQGAL